MSPSFQIIFGYILVAACAIGTLAAGLMVKNGYDRKNEKSTMNQPMAIQTVRESKISVKENKQKIAKIQINRIIEDVTPWLNDKIEQNRIETERITNDVNSRGMLYSGPHIAMQIKRVNGFIRGINDYIKEMNRKIEDLLLGVGEDKFETATWLKAEQKNYIDFIERAKTVKNSIKQQIDYKLQHFLSCNDAVFLKNQGAYFS